MTVGYSGQKETSYQNQVKDNHIDRVQDDQERNEDQKSHGVRLGFVLVRPSKGDLNFDEDLSHDSKGN